MTINALLRIFFRWKVSALVMFLASFGAGVFTAYRMPLYYEAEATVENKPLRVSAQRSATDFDMTRLTSDNQRNLAILKNRYLLERWQRAINPNSLADPKMEEKRLKRLGRSLSVKPVNFTDLYVIRVKGSTPEEARNRLEKFIDVYGTWDTGQRRSTEEATAELLRERLLVIRGRLRDAREQAQERKAGRPMRLSATTSDDVMEEIIAADEKLADSLSAELEGLEQRLRAATTDGMRVVLPITGSKTPVQSRAMLVVLALVVSLVLTGALVVLLEWQNPYVQRVGDIHRIMEDIPVIVMPRLRTAAGFDTEFAVQANTLLAAVVNAVKEKGRVVVQVVGGTDGDGKSVFLDWMTRMLAQSSLSVGLLTYVPKRKNRTVSFSSSAGETEAFVDGSVALHQQIEKLLSRHQVVLFDGGQPASPAEDGVLLSFADVICMVVGAGSTPRSHLQLWNRHVRRYSGQKPFVVVNPTRDPLPSWLRIA